MPIGLSSVRAATRWSAALALLLLAGCGEGGDLGARAQACWGLPGDCVGALAGARVGLGVGGVDRAALEAPCGPAMVCTNEAPPATGALAGRPSPSPGAPPEAVVPSPDAAVAAVPAPTPARGAAPTVASAGGKSCADLSPAELDAAASLSPADLLCLGDIARGTTNAADADRQTAAIALYNRKAGGWGGAVEAALERPALQNAPALNFAGIKAAYDSGKYGAVVKRADLVWGNLDKGFQLASGDKDFLVEFACRASAQMALAGKAPGNGLTWCERWMARAVKAGRDTTPIQDLIDQLE